MKVCSCPQSSEWINFPHSASCIILLFLTLKCIPWVFSEPGHHSLPSHFFFLKVETNFLSIPQSIYYKQNNKKNYVKYKMSVFLKHFFVKSVQRCQRPKVCMKYALFCSFAIVLKISRAFFAIAAYPSVLDIQVPDRSRPEYVMVKHSCI